MNIKLTEIERDALRALLVHRSRAIRSEGSGFVAMHLADQYGRLADMVAAAKIRKGQIGLTLTKADSQRIEALIAHDRSPVLRPLLAKIHAARRPKADPRRPSGRRTSQEVA